MKEADLTKKAGVAVSYQKKYPFGRTSVELRAVRSAASPPSVFPVLILHSGVEKLLLLTV